jgi:hypothetical protein
MLPETLVTWALTYTLHSTGLLLLAKGVTARLREPAYREMLWKVALIGGLLTATLQVAGLVRPLAGQLLVMDVLTQPTLALSGLNGEAARLVTGAVATTISVSSTPFAKMVEVAVPVALIAWVVGSATHAVRLAIGVHRLRLQLAGRLSLSVGSMPDALHQLQLTAGYSGPVRVSLAPRLTIPLALAGLRGGEICLPPQALVALTPVQQQHLLAHELAHLTRRDAWWLWLGAVLEVVCFFQPLNRCARQALQTEAEFLCDRWAARSAGDPVALAQCLVEVATWAVQPQLPVLSGITGRGGMLMARVTRLTGRPAREPVRVWWVQAGWIMALIGLLLVTVRLLPSIGLAWPLVGTLAARLAQPLQPGEAAIIDPRLQFDVRARLPAGATDVVLAPNDQYLVFRLGPGQTADLYLMETTTGAIRALTDDQGGNIQPLWSPDSQYLAYFSHRDGYMNVYVMPVIGGPGMRLTNDTTLRHLFGWTVDGSLWFW